MPPKAKLHKNTGKSIIRPIQVTPQNTAEASTSSITPELEQQFEIELCWCIQQLQTALKSGKLNQKQIQDNTKTLNTLMSNSAPMVKKRQVMRLSFGDYRAKMSAEDKKISRNVTKIKVSTATPSKKSVFVKKSLFASTSGAGFRFNFEQPSQTTNDCDISENLSNVKLENNDCNTNNEIKLNIKEENNLTNNYRYLPSSNAFRFNFSSNEES